MNQRLVTWDGVQKMEAICPGTKVCKKIATENQYQLFKMVTVEFILVLSATQKLPVVSIFASTRSFQFHRNDSTNTIFNCSLHR